MSSNLLTLPCYTWLKSYYSEITKLAVQNNSTLVEKFDFIHCLAKHARLASMLPILSLIGMLLASIQNPSRKHC